jgi:hypothetical protein
LVTLGKAVSVEAYWTKSPDAWLISNKDASSKVIIAAPYRIAFLNHYIPPSPNQLRTGFVADILRQQ